jgi:hypothetical protein
MHVSMCLVQFSEDMQKIPSYHHFNNSLANDLILAYFQLKIGTANRLMDS